VNHLAFTLATHRAVAPDPAGNACWSPFSVASALTLTATGARGMTQDELAVLLLGDKSGDFAPLRRLLGAAGRLSDKIGPDDEKPILAVANTMWADPMIPIREEFAAELGEWSSGTVRHAPFQHAPEDARREINADVARTTHDLIRDLLPKGVITRDTVAALVNALYLKCAWRHKFADAVPRPFHSPAGPVEVPTMELTESLGYAALDGWRVVSLPAVGGVDAVILLPDKELAVAEPSLDTARLTRLLAAPKPTRVRLRLPKIDVSWRAELTPPLQGLGVRTVFTQDADLSGISHTPVAVQAVLHESVLKLDEQGLEGAAATAVMFRLLSLRGGVPVEVDVDRPFLLVIRHVETGVCYFLARVVTFGS
jgi:serine protease inhibitor